jgi:hypothetical protein
MLVVGRMSIAARTIIELNIKHYRDLLRTETDLSKRKAAAKMLSEAEVKLAELSIENRKEE